MYEAPPSPEGAAVSVILDNLPNPFPVLTTVTTEVKVENEPCAACLRPLGTRGLLRPVCCDYCKEYWHLRCAGLQMPPRYNSWGCRRCQGQENK